MIAGVSSISEVNVYELTLGSHLGNRQATCSRRRQVEAQTFGSNASAVRLMDTVSVCWGDGEGKEFHGFWVSKIRIWLVVTGIFFVFSHSVGKFGNGITSQLTKSYFSEG